MYLLSPVKYKVTYRVLAHNNMLLLQFIHYMFRNSSFYVEDILEEYVYVYLYVCTFHMYCIKWTIVLYPKWIENFLVLVEFIMQHFNLLIDVKFQFPEMGGLNKKNAWSIMLESKIKGEKNSVLCAHGFWKTCLSALLAVFPGTGHQFSFLIVEGGNVCHDFACCVCAH